MSSGSGPRRRRSPIRPTPISPPKPRVYDLLQKEIDGVNRTLPAAAKIRKFVLLYKELDADDESSPARARCAALRRGAIQVDHRGALRRREQDRRGYHHPLPGRRTARIQANLAVREMGAA